MITREENGRVSLQVASSRCGGNRASSDLVFVFPNIRPPNTPSDGLLLHTNHKTVFYAVPVCIYAVCHYVSSVYP